MSQTAFPVWGSVPDAAVAAASAAADIQTGGVGVCPWELAHLLDVGRVRLIDVRDPVEYADCHIPGAVLLPLARLSAASPELAGASHVVFCCKSGLRSAQAADRIRRSAFQGYVSQLGGGIQAWIAAGLIVSGDAS